MKLMNQQTLLFLFVKRKLKSLKMKKVLLSIKKPLKLLIIVVNFLAVLIKEDLKELKRY